MLCRDFLSQKHTYRTRILAGLSAVKSPSAKSYNKTHRQMFLSKQINDNNRVLCFSNTKNVGNKLAAKRSKHYSDKPAEIPQQNLTLVLSKYNRVIKLKCYFSVSHL